MSLLKKATPAAGAAPAAKPTLKKAAPAPVVEEEAAELVEDAPAEEFEEAGEEGMEEAGEEAVEEAAEEAAPAPAPKLGLKKPAAPAAKPAAPVAKAPVKPTAPAAKPAAPAAKPGVKPAAPAAKPAKAAPAAAPAGKKAPSLKLGSAKVATKTPMVDFEIFTSEDMTNSITVQISESLVPEVGSRFNRDGLIALVAERLKHEGFTDINLETTSKIVKGLEDVLLSITSNFDIRFMGTMFKLVNVKERVYPPRPGSEEFINGYYMPTHTRSKSDRNITGAAAYPFVYGEDGSIQAVDPEQLKAALDEAGISVAPTTSRATA